MHKIKSKIGILIKIAIVLFSLVLIILENNSQVLTPRFTTDFVSWGLSGMAPIFKIGYPYVNYWGINPPGLLLFTTAWGFLISSTLLSFHFLYIILITTITFLTWKILNNFFSFIESSVLFFIFLILFFSGTVQSQFFPSEINGLFFTLVGLFFTLKKRPSKKDFFWASFSFILAGQMKEVFAFTGLALFPQLLKSIHLGKKEMKNFIIFTILGILASFILIFGYLKINGALYEYKSILDYKSSQFSLDELSLIGGNLFRSISYPKERFIYNKTQLPVILLVSFISFLTYLTLISKSKKNKKKTIEFKLSLPYGYFNYGILLFFWLGSTIGYMLQGRYGNKYEIQSLLPMILITALSIKVYFRTFLTLFKIKLSKNKYILFTALFLIIFLLPKKFFFIEQYRDFKSYNFKTHIHRILNLENPESIALENYINSKTSSSECITAVYGWGIGNHYYYSRRASCSKHFLVNILPITEYHNYQQELINNPPRAIIYNTAGADIDINQFEDKAFNFTKVINSCYIQDQKFIKLYWSKLTGEELSACISIGIPNTNDNEVEIR